MSKQWNKHIREQLQDFPKKAPEGLLDDIKAEMHHRGIGLVPITGTRKSLRPSIIRYMTAAAAILLFLFSWQHYRKNLPISAPSHEIAVQPLEMEETISTYSLDQRDESTTIWEYKPQTAFKAEPTPSVSVSIMHITEKAEYREEEKSIPTDTIVNNMKSQHTPTNTSRQQTRSVSSHLLAQAHSPKKTSFTAGIYYSGFVANNGTDLSRYGSNGYNYAYSVENGFTSEHSTSEEKEHHHIPIKMGISIQYDINGPWFLQSGLTYSYLASELSQSNNRISYETKQKLHYIGIPLQLGYRIWKGKRFNGYVSGGGQMERMISGKATTDYCVNNVQQSSSTKDISDNRLLFSVIASVGLEYTLNKDFSIYVEPGIHYYFKNGNKLKTHYNEQPLNFNITVGFRFHWKD